MPRIAPKWRGRNKSAQASQQGQDGADAETENRRREDSHAPADSMPSIAPVPSATNIPGHRQRITVGMPRGTCRKQCCRPRTNSENMLPISPRYRVDACASDQIGRLVQADPA